MASSPEQATAQGGAATPDIIDHLAGVAPGSALAGLRAARPEVVRFARGSYLALLEPDDLAGVGRLEREAVGLRVGVLTPSRAVADWHRERLRRVGADDATIAAIERTPAAGALAPRLAAIMRHTDLLIREPRAATPAHLADLKAAGLTPRDIVTISQLIAYLSFEVRLLAGLRLFAEGA